MKSGRWPFGPPSANVSHEGCGRVSKTESRPRPAAYLGCPTAPLPPLAGPGQRGSACWSSVRSAGVSISPACFASRAIS